MHWLGAASSQLSVLVPPAIVAAIVVWYTFAALADLPLSVVLGCVAFVTITPMLASMSDRNLARRRRSK
ncbi:hypothetical protein GCM10011349_29470 [Novosphingobium indicum]|uniref:Uncharacterized protein n=1 Tax=Novosphingobium indicum TaxID=462949 RepID=A0ABQ2JVK1_9SPHN|nr:hypothetical protein GCM10011349_29470 [Novosphingobium indicum]